MAKESTEVDANVKQRTGSVGSSVNHSITKLTLESRLFLIFGLIFGGACLVVLPPFMTFDGPPHFWRAVQIERGDFRSARYSNRSLGGMLPGRFGAIVDLLWYKYWSTPNDFGTVSTWRRAVTKAEEARPERKIEFTQTAVYSPVNYLFQCVGIGIGQTFTKSPLVDDRLGCLSNLLGYLLVVVAALELLPHFRRGLLLVATSPLLVTQAASMSTDGINFSVPVLLLAWVAHLRFVKLEPAAKDIGFAVLLGWLAALLKPTAIVCSAIVWLIPVRFFDSRWKKAGILSGYTLSVVLLWWIWNKPYFDVEMAQWFDPKHPPSALLKALFLQHPWKFFPVFTHVVIKTLPDEWPMFFGYFLGWGQAAGIYMFFKPLSLILFAALVVCGEWPGPVDRFWAMGILLQSLALLFLTSLTLWLIFATVATVGDANVPGLAGRYLFFVYFGLSFGWAEFTHRILPRFRGGLFWLGIGANALWLSLNLFALGAKTIG